jgi:hypothetical protein
VFLLELMNKLQIAASYYDTLFSLSSLTNQAASSLDSLYAEFDTHNTGYVSPLELWKSVGLDHYLSLSFSSLYASKISETSTYLLSSLSAAITRNNYNQGTHDMPSLVGLISHVPLMSGTLFSLNEGNSELPRKAAEASNASVHLNTNIKVVLHDPHNKKYVLFGGDDGDIVLGQHDTLVIAAPMRALLDEGVKFMQVSPWDNTVVEDWELDVEDSAMDYVTTVTSFVYSKNGIRPEYYGVDSVTSAVLYTCPDGSDCENVFTVNMLHAFEGDYRRGDGAAGVFKVFSKNGMSESDVGAIFGDGARVLKEHKWNEPGAYPNYQNTKGECGDFRISTELYYTNAIECTASAMEIAAVGARNVANLIVGKGGVVGKFKGKGRREETEHPEL